MATIEQLAANGHLQRLKVRLNNRFDYDERRIYCSHEFFEWLNGTVKSAEPFYKQDISPKQQAYAMLKHFITGKPMGAPKLYKRMSPKSDDVWELKSQDIRIFGWFYQKDCFIAQCGDLFENLKLDPSLYELHRIHTVNSRLALDLDEPKCLKGGTELDVTS